MRKAKKSTTWITVNEILDDLGITRRTWQRWRARGTTPPCTKLPGRELRIRRSDYNAWLSEMEEVA
ncbi:helix-turn-helix transcriptional regulator [Spirillospora sp. CA-294931]|uniref:helix-turn-helix transcriptional regulator n=1 Tax=Spirillospora sp. CA-294931 TaxID=3240042 RepID=UPI003D8B0A59